MGMSADRIVVVPKGGASEFRHDRAWLPQRLNNSSIFPFNSIRVSGKLSKTLFERSVFIADIRRMRSTQERITCTQSSQLQLLPEPILAAFKSYATRALRHAGLDKNIQPWLRHGSTVYLWTERHVNKGIEYVVLGQDHPFAVEPRASAP